MLILLHDITKRDDSIIYLRKEKLIHLSFLNSSGIQHKKNNNIKIALSLKFRSKSIVLSLFRQQMAALVCLKEYFQ